MSPRLAPLTAMNAAVLLLALAGCQTTASEPTASATSPAPVIKTEQGGQAAQTGQKTNGQDKRRHVSQRYFQLDELDRVKIKVDGKHEFTCWVMDTEMKRQEGMMYLEESDFKADEGMIFVFREAIPLRFWMRNTLVPLDIAYVTDKKTILSMYTMKARDEVTDYSSKGDAKYAIEFKAGTFKDKKITKGMKIEIPDSVKEKEF